MSKMTEILVKSSLDSSIERNLFYMPENLENVPLLVGLHTWSFDRFNQQDAMLPYCVKRGWALLLPEFRGPNLPSNPRLKEACGSALARQDIIDAVAYVLKNYRVDSKALMLLGGSGGGHMALMTAAHSGCLWKAVSSWVPVTDLKAWHSFNPKYGAFLEAVCGGAPGTSPELDKAYAARSPISFIDKLKNVNLAVHHGRYDEVISYKDSWHFAEALESVKPERFFFEIFDGGHDLVYERAFEWLDTQLNKKDSDKLSG